ncbi:MAG TPA: hypothetical protein V6D22_05250 [Candidatus Obscuribacterales bacterium]
MTSLGELALSDVTIIALAFQQQNWNRGGGCARSRTSSVSEDLER